MSIHVETKNNFLDRLDRSVHVLRSGTQSPSVFAALEILSQLRELIDAETSEVHSPHDAVAISDRSSPTDHESTENLTQLMEKIKNMGSMDGLDDLKEPMNLLQNSMRNMQHNMEQTYSTLQNRSIEGVSNDGSVVAKLSGTYKLLDLSVKQIASQRVSMKEFIEKIKEAMRQAHQKVEALTQEHTLNFLKNIPMPEGLENFGSLQELFEQKKEKD